MDVLHEIIKQLQDQVLENGTWSLSRDQLEGCFDPVDFYRRIYRSGGLGPDHYGPENVGELIEVIEAQGLEESADHLRDAGLILTWDQRIGLTDRLIRTVTHEIVVHTPEAEMFRSMLEHLKRYDVALHTYITTYFDQGRLIEICLNDHLSAIRHRAPWSNDSRALEVLTRTVKAYLVTLFGRRIVEIEAFDLELFETLRTVARQEGKLPSGRRSEEPEYQDAHQPERQPDSRQQALAVLGLSHQSPNPREIRLRYRDLMRRYHPDVNPDGLEMAKKITNAYGLLAAELN